MVSGFIAKPIQAEDSIPGWIFQWGGVKEIIKEGDSHILHVKDGGACGTSRARAIQWIVLESNKSYILSEKIKGTGGKAQGDEWCTGGSKGSISKGSVVFSINSNWQDQTRVFVSSECDSDQEHKLAIYFDTCDGQEIYSDNVSLKEWEIPGWSFYGGLNNKGNSYVLDNSGHEGNKSVKLIVASQAVGTTAYTVLSQDISSLAGKKIKITGWLKTDGGATTKAFLGYKNNTDNTAEFINKDNPVIAATWTYLEATFSLPAGKSSSVRLQVNGPGAAWFDDILAQEVVEVSPSPVSAESKYTYKQRFGAGFDQHNGDSVARKIDEFPYQKLGLGWYFDWGNDGGPRENMEYMGLVGSYGDGSSCQNLKLKNLVNANKQKYPDNMMWTVGNQIGWDDGKTALEYADDFIKWYDCLKSINPTFQIGSGAIISPWHQTPHTDNNCGNANGKVDINVPNSGKNYFIKYINRIKDIDKNKLPDFIVNHGYTHCNGGFTVEAFKASIVEQRKEMKELGLQNKDLIIKEFFSGSDPRKDFETRQKYLKDTVEYLVNEKNAEIGNPEDGNRLVQRFAWFVLNDRKGKNKDRYIDALSNTENGELTPLGDLYRQIIKKYTNPSEVYDDRFGIGGEAGVDSILGIKTVRGWCRTGCQGYHQDLINGGFNSFFLTGNMGSMRCKKSSSDSTEVNCNTVPKTGIPIDPSFDEIKTYASNYKNQAWEIVNEPDWGPYIKPEDYAVWYHMFSQEILEYDPTAKIMSGGLITSVVWHVYNYFYWNRSGNGNLGNEDLGFLKADEHSNTRFSWITRFRNKYKELYGDYPQVDIWNIHPYLQFTDTDGQGKTYLNYERVANDIKEFRTFLENLPETEKISEKNKPIYISEFGAQFQEGYLSWNGIKDENRRNVGNGTCLYHGCLTQQETEKEWQMVNKFVNDITGWLSNPDNLSYSQKWFWYYYGPEYTWAGTSQPSVMAKVNQANIDRTTPADNNTPENATLSFPADINEPNLIAMNYSRAAKSYVLFNKSFEALTFDKQPYAWWLWKGGPGDDYSHEVIENNSQAHSGNRYLKINVGKDKGEFGHIAIINQTMNTTYYSGKNIKFSGWCKTSNGGQAGLKITITNTKGERNSNWEPSIVGQRDCSVWTKLETNRVTIPQDIKTLEFEGVATGQNGIVNFDDFNIEVDTSN